MRLFDGYKFQVMVDNYSQYYAIRILSIKNLTIGANL